MSEMSSLALRPPAGLWDLAHLQPKPGIVVPGETIPAVFWKAVELRADKVWMRQKEFGIWRAWTWRQTADAVREIAGGLLALGFGQGECASILANTVIEWVLCDVAVLSCGGVSNGIYPTDAASQVHYLCEDSRTTVLFVEDDEQLDKALEVRARLPMLRKIVVFDMEGLRDLDDPGVISLDALRMLGREYLQAHPQALEQRIAGCRPEDLAILVYTSGTTGKPKGAMHSHRGLVYTPCWRRARATSACASCRCATSPSAWAANTSRCTPARFSTSSKTPKRCQRTCAKFRPPCSPPCRACGRSSIRA
jgi:long-chain acyl-CoA synthetase